MTGVFRPISLNFENRVLSPIARKVNEKNATLRGSVPNETTGATALAPAATEGYVSAIADNTILVAIYPKMNLGNLYHKTPRLTFVFVCLFLTLYVHIVASKNDITPIHTSIITLVITAE